MLVCTGCQCLWYGYFDCLSEREYKYFVELIMYPLLLYNRASSGCNSEQKAASVLGYNEVTWDNPWQKQPFSSDKAWGALTEQEKEAAVLLGYTEIIWDNLSGYETQPASLGKLWSMLTICGECRCA